MRKLQSNFEQIIINPEMVMLSFKHKKEIMDVFNDVLGLCCLDHVSVDVCSCDNQYAYFSTQPSLGFNLVAHDLWQYDGSISPTIFKHHSFYWWENAYHPMYKNKLKNIKEIEYKYTLGCILVRKINNYYIIYSFGTKNNIRESKKYFFNNLNKLLKIGDYCFNRIRPIYQMYYNKHDCPIIKKFFPYQRGKPIETTTLATNYNPKIVLVARNGRLL